MQSRNIDNTAHTGIMKLYCLSSSLVQFIPRQFDGENLRLRGEGQIWETGGGQSRVGGNFPPVCMYKSALQCCGVVLRLAAFSRVKFFIFSIKMYFYQSNTHQQN